MQTLDPQPRDERTAALRAAVRNGDLDACRALLDADRSLVRTASLRGGSLALEAHERELPEIAELLFAARGDGLDMDVHEAASLGRPNGIRNAVTADPLCLDAEGPQGFLPAHRAAYRGHVDALLFLLEAGADPSGRAANAAALTPLHSAVAGMARLGTGARGVETIRLLLTAGADPTLEAEGGWTPAAAAARDGLEEAHDLLESAARARGGADDTPAASADPGAA